MVGVHELLHLQKRKQKTLEMERVENATVKRVEVHDRIPISYLVQRWYQQLKDPMKYLQHSNLSMLT